MLILERISFYNAVEYFLLFVPCIVLCYLAFYVTITDSITTSISLVLFDDDDDDDDDDNDDVGHDDDGFINYVQYFQFFFECLVLYCVTLHFM